VEGDLETAADYSVANDSPGIFLPMNPAPIPPDDSTYSGRVASRLKELRVKAGLTVEEMVERLSQRGVNVAVGTYYHWEAGRRDISLNAVPAIASALSLKKASKLFPD
jgi:DNA-binding XRE family transcriptional regulator